MIEKSYEEIIELEQERQNNNVELIASENFPSRRVLNAAGSILTNKYAEGYPGKRYYGGCEFIDMIERKAIEDVCNLFKCNFANVQPHCGSSANQAVYRALLHTGDTVMGMDLGAGGHLTHGHKMSFSGQDYNIISYGIDENGIIDYAEFEKLMEEYNPKMIIVGASSYSRTIDYKVFRDMIEEYAKKHDGQKPYYMVDMAHVAGLIAGGVHPSPIPYADVVTSTTHKTLRGPRGGLILTNSEDIIKKLIKLYFQVFKEDHLNILLLQKVYVLKRLTQKNSKNMHNKLLKMPKHFQRLS